MQEALNRLKGRRPKIHDVSLLSTAVLLPLLKIKDRYHLLFEVRSKKLHSQPGEICFPGGKLEGHETPVEAALRETAEELGIRRNDVEITGTLDILVAPQGVIIYPFAGILHTNDIRPCSEEVEKIFTVPVDFFLTTPPYITYVDVATAYQPDFPLFKVSSAYREGWQKRYSYPMYYYEYENYFIWGLTGKILYNFFEICFPEELPEGRRYEAKYRSQKSEVRS